MLERREAEFPSSQGGDPVHPHPPEHLDMNKKVLKEPLFSFSWRHLTRESPKHLHFPLFFLAYSEQTKSHVCGFPKINSMSLTGDRCEPPEAGGRLLREQSSDLATS